jgi:ABC-type multidrug transport system ATPase subunit
MNGVSISLSAVSLSYERAPLFKDLSLKIEPGEKLLLLGENGAGKSTLLKLMAGIIEADLGEIFTTGSLAYYSSSDLMFSPSKTILENLALYSQIIENLRGVKFNCEDLRREIERWHLNQVINCQVDALSSGERNRAALLRTFLGAPEIMLFDEPSTALDQDGTAILLATLSQHSSATMVIATHEPDLFKEIATKTSLLKDSKLTV